MAKDVLCIIEDQEWKEAENEPSVESDMLSSLFETIFEHPPV